MSDIQRSGLLETIEELEYQTDINQVGTVDVLMRLTESQEKRYWSYQHFFVLYTTFWTLDTDHDMFISKDELASYAGHGSRSRSCCCHFDSFISMHYQAHI